MDEKKAVSQSPSQRNGNFILFRSNNIWNMNKLGGGISGIAHMQSWVAHCLTALVINMHTVV